MIGLKTILKLCAIGIFATSTPIATYNLVEENKHNNLARESLYNSIINESSPISTLEKWSVDGLDFYSQDELYSYLINKGDIQEVQTSSNPSKIISDAANGILESDKIYDLNQNNYQQVYRDAFGNVALLKKDAINTYVNGGTVRHKYSYDNINWFDSPTEAQNSYVYQGGLRKSLYYYINGRYYNAFNKSDAQAMRNVLKEGYRISSSVMTNNTVLYGTKNTIQNTVESILRSSWVKSKSNVSQNELHYINFASKQVEHNFSVNTSPRILFKVHYTDGTQEQYESTRKVKFIFDDKDIKLDYFSNKTNWEKAEDTAWIGIDKLRFYYYFMHSGVDLTKNENKPFYKVEFYPIDTNSGQGVSDVLFENQNISEEYETAISLYADLKKTIKLRNFNLNSNIASWTNLSTQEVNSMYDEWFYYFKNNYLFANIPQEESNINLNDINQPENEYGVARDYLYDINGQQGEKYSYYENMYNYHKFQKQKILDGETKFENGITYYRINEMFWATREQVENYIYLFGTMDVRLMYTFIDEQDISSIDGLVLASTEAEARRKLFEYESAILLNRWFAYDVFGNHTTSGESEEDAIVKMQSTITLTSKYINKKEIESWNGQPKSYSEIVQDGVYTIYSVNLKNSSEGKIYFYSYDTALAALIQGVDNTSLSLTEEQTLYMYVHINENGDKTTYIFKDDDDIQNIMNQILG